MATQGKYAVVDTTLSITDSTPIPGLNGRQGDNGRIVYFALKDGRLPHNLDGQDVTLQVKDSAGKIKIVNGIYDMISATAGLFSMYIPKEVYQAAGNVQEAFLSIIGKDERVVSTIPLTFTVIENGIIVSTNASQEYIDSIQKIIDEFNERINSAENNLGDFQKIYDSLEKDIADYTKLVNDNAVAVKNKENEFTQKIIFDEGIESKKDILGNLVGNVKGNLHGDADNAHLFNDHDFAESLGHEAFRLGTRFFAHRGAQSIAPENSLPAIKKVSNHCGIEVDIHQTSDGVWMVMHDGNIDRMTSKTGAISGYTFSELRQIPISKGANANTFSNEDLVIPTLEEVLTIAKDKRLVPVIEIKVDNSDKYTSDSYDSLVNIIKKFGIEKEMMFISFNYDALVEIKRRLPLVEVSYLVGQISDENINKAKDLGENSGLDVEFTDATVNGDRISIAHEAGLKIGVWTTNDDNRRLEMVSKGVDFITTNSLSGELRYQELSLQNNWRNNRASTRLTSYVTEIAPGKIEVRFLIIGGTRNQSTLIAELPDWATPTSKIWSPVVVRTYGKPSPVILGTVDIDKPNGTNANLTVGLGWAGGNSSNDGDWVSGNIIYYI